MTGHETWDELAAIHALGGLDGEDLERFQAHLADGCPACARTLRDSHEALARLALGATPAVPPADVKAALLARLAATPPRRASRTGWLTWTAATAVVVALAAMLTAGVVASRYEKRLGQMAREMAADRDRLRQDEASLRRQVEAYQGAVALLHDPATRVVELRGQSDARATARLIWNDRAGGHLLVDQLAPAPEGRTYELWALGGPAPHPAGLVHITADGRAVERVEPLGEAPTGFAITLEPAGGVPAPTGPVVLASR